MRERASDREIISSRRSHCTERILCADAGSGDHPRGNDGHFFSNRLRHFERTQAVLARDQRPFRSCWTQLTK